MHVRKLLGTLAVGGLLLAAAPAWAQFRANSFNISGWAGANIRDIATEIEDQVPGMDWTAGVSLNLAIEYVTPFPWVGIEVTGSFTPVDVDTPTVRDYQFNSWYFAGNAVLHILPDQSVVPYLTAGAGIVVFDPDRGDSQTKFVFNAGGGVDIFVWRARNERTGLAIRLDGRFYGYKFEAADFDAVTVRDLGLPGRFDETLWDFTITGGLRLTF